MKKIKVSYKKFQCNVINMTFWYHDEVDESFVGAILCSFFIWKSFPTVTKPLRKTIFSVLVIYGKNWKTPIFSEVLELGHEPPGSNATISRFKQNSSNSYFLFSPLTRLLGHNATPSPRPFYHKNIGGKKKTRRNSTIWTYLIGNYKNLQDH